MASGFSGLGALILAAGKGTRMHSDKPKVLQTLLGEPMLAYVMAALAPVMGEAVWAVIGHNADMVRKAFPEFEAQQRFILQEQQLGTGHALQMAWPTLRAAGLEKVIVVNGDTPLLSADTVARFVEGLGDADVAFMTLTLPEAGAYGRVVRDADGAVKAIVEAKDYDEDIHGPEPKEINTGIYSVRLDAVEKLLSQLSNDNRSAEYYITDIVGLAVAQGMQVLGIECGDDPSLLGVNNPVELSRSEELLSQRITLECMEKGVIMHAPQGVRIGPFALVEAGAEITGPCEIYGKSHVARGAVIESHCWMKDAYIDSGSVVKSFSHIERASVGKFCSVGPFARLRPDAILENEARIGNFVEMKKARLGHGAKAGHLSYLGDADIAAGCNIGAGTITCNYDGKNKHRTVIGENAFIGSNTALVAPVSIGDGSIVGAGSVITKDVPSDHLAIARERQRNLPRKRGA
ncbi:MAG: bifunctional UDP-N-acetylglucosamine diphosphorylase/glucosamine-1-phosphate N-acetyltransferase GlmU [Pseudomonadota bacterium]